jgi:hypothetical protein
MRRTLDEEGEGKTRATILGDAPATSRAIIINAAMRDEDGDCHHIASLAGR